MIQVLRWSMALAVSSAVKLRSADTMEDSRTKPSDETRPKHAGAGSGLGRCLRPNRTGCGEGRISCLPGGNTIRTNSLRQRWEKKQRRYVLGNLQFCSVFWNRSLGPSVVPWSSFVHLLSVFEPTLGLSATLTEASPSHSHVRPACEHCCLMSPVVTFVFADFFFFYTNFPNLDSCCDETTWVFNYFQWALKSFEILGQIDESLACKCSFIKHLVKYMHLLNKTMNIVCRKSNISCCDMCKELHFFLFQWPNKSSFFLWYERISRY